MAYLTRYIFMGSRILGAFEPDPVLWFNLFGPAATWIMVLVRFVGATNIFPAGTVLFAAGVFLVLGYHPLKSYRFGHLEPKDRDQPSSQLLGWFLLYLIHMPQNGLILPFMSDLSRDLFHIINS
jgi:hypothetical protein